MTTTEVKSKYAIAMDEQIRRKDIYVSRLIENGMNPGLAQSFGIIGMRRNYDLLANEVIAVIPMGGKS